MQPVLLIFLASVVFTINQQFESSPDTICGKAKDERCMSGGVLNGKILSIDSCATPQKAPEKQIDGTVAVQLIFNEDGEVISARPASGPEELWAASIKVAVSTRFPPTKLSGKPIKVTGVLHVKFKNGKIEPLKQKPGRVTIVGGLQ